MPTFRDLGVLPEICDALESKGIIEPFAIQEMTLSVALEGTDLIGQARTGTGKTFAFGIPAVQRIGTKGNGKPQALIVAPTRELALQVFNDVELISGNLGLRVLSIYGGVGFEPQIEALEAGVDVVVGTPGRIIDMVNRKHLDLSDIKTLVLDEADEMLDLGFLPDVEKILAKTPKNRQTMLFSATMPAAIISLARTHLVSPMNIRAEASYENATHKTTTQFVYQAHDLDKPEMIGRLLQGAPEGGVDKVVVFARTKRQAQRVADDLVERGFNAGSLHGDMAQIAREKAMQRFRDGKIQILVCTDVAARGIDVTGVSHVINYTTPDDEKTYVHRIGRTGRAGASGVAVTLVDWADIHKWKMINKALELDFDEPVETYSSSENFLTDHHIVKGTKGRIKKAAPAERPTRSGGRDAKDGAASGSTSEKSERAPRNRNRTRTRSRNGEKIEGAAAPAAEAVAGEAGAAAAGSASPQAEGAAPKARRRRRRSSGGGSSAAAAASTD